jgi:hypothetical protein
MQPKTSYIPEQPVLDEASPLSTASNTAGTSKDGTSAGKRPAKQLLSDSAKKRKRAVNTFRNTSPVTPTRHQPSYENALRTRGPAAFAFGTLDDPVSSLLDDENLREAGPENTFAPDEYVKNGANRVGTKMR